MAIDLRFSDEQKLIQDSARQFFAQRCPPELVRQYHNAADEFPDALWQEMADLGWLGMAFAEDHGGLGMGLLDLIPIYIEMGRSLAPVPHLETVMLCGGLITALGSDEQKSSLLPAIAEGRLILAPALYGMNGLAGAANIDLVGTPERDGFRLSGSAALVANAGRAGWLLCAARTDDGESLFLVDAKDDAVHIERSTNIASLPLYTISMENLFVPAAGRLGAVGDAGPAIEEAMARCGVLVAAMVWGAGERVLDMTVGYAKDRAQFGTQIGKHQAVQYLITNIAMESHHVGLLALQAAWLIDNGLPWRREAAFAKAAANHAAAHMTFCSHEVHAGIGFMGDYDLQLYTLRAKYWENVLGDTHQYLHQIAADMLD